jgi:RND family efflux transporter MFP subunit
VLATFHEKNPPSVTSEASSGINVEVITPRPGGLVRECVQPGTVQPFEYADLYAKVSGFLDKLNVDIGSHVKKGDVLAHISVPEDEKQVDQDTAAVEHTKARVKQMQAHLVAAEAEAEAARGMVEEVAADLLSKTSYREFREKQFIRIKELGDRQAIDERLVDEKEDQLQAAISAENSAKAGIVTAKLNADSADARVLTAKADLEEAKAEVKVAEATLAKSNVILSYNQIVSPYDGVISNRTVHPGDFIRAEQDGGLQRPLLTVERIDLMRVVVQVPDRDVPLTNPGDNAIVRIDALPGVEFVAKVSRIAEAEDPQTRMMRTEIDLANPDMKLRHGMYGRVTILLRKPPEKAFNLPSTALANLEAGKRATVWVVRDGKARQIPVEIGLDTGVNVEILSGLKENDQVIVGSESPIIEGASVSVTAAPSENSDESTNP